MSALTILILPPQKKNAFSEWKGNREKSKDFVCLFLCFGLFVSFLLGFCVPVRWMRWSVWMGLSIVLSVFVQWNTCILSTSFTIKTVFKCMDLKGFKWWWLQLNWKYHRPRARFRKGWARRISSDSGSRDPELRSSGSVNWVHVRFKRFWVTLSRSHAPY